MNQSSIPDIVRLQLQGDNIQLKTVDALDVLESARLFFEAIKSLCPDLDIRLIDMNSDHSAVSVFEGIHNSLEPINGATLLDSSSKIESCINNIIVVNFKRKIIEVAKKYDSIFSIVNDSDDKIPLYIVDKNTPYPVEEIISEVGTIKGKSKIYGEFKGYKGSSKKDRIFLIPLGEKAIKEFQCLDNTIFDKLHYDQVYGFEGEATWNSNNDIVDFEIHDLLSYSNLDPKEAFRKLSEVSIFWRTVKMLKLN